MSHQLDLGRGDDQWVLAPTGILTHFAQLCRTSTDPGAQSPFV